MSAQAARVELGPEFADALLYAFELHARQRRKGPDGPPYVGHLLVVAGTVIDVGGSEEEAIAALLHDAAEDQGGEERLAKIERRFGPAVARIVRECSDSTAVEKRDWRPRKESYIDSIGGKSEGALRVSIADKLHNARAILRDHERHGDAVWERFSASKEEIAWYYRSLVDAFRRRASALEAQMPHLAELDGAVGLLERAAGVAAAAA